MGLADEFRHAVFEAAYESPVQRRRRAAASMLLGLKHGLRGFLFSWPLYMLALASLALPISATWLFAPLIAGGILVSIAILRKGVGEDYRERVEGRILEVGEAWRLIRRPAA